MLKTLIKKQYHECFRNYFVNAKTGKARSKAGVAGFFVFFALVMLMLCGIFMFLAQSLIKPLAENNLMWLYYALMSILAIALGVFGSVFNTYATLYLPKDNDLLMPMPIPPMTILKARMSLVMGLSLLYSGSVWLPALVCSWIYTTPTAIQIVFGVLLFLVISLLVTVLSCLLGWVVAVVATKVKNKSFTIVIISVVLFALYYVVCFRMTDFIQSIILNSTAVGAGMQKWANLFYQLGCAADGSVSAMLIITGIVLALYFICSYVLSRSFTRVVANTPTVSKTKAKAKTQMPRSFKSALFHRELKRFTANPNYMLNCGFGMLLVIVIAVVFLIKYNALQALLPELAAELPDLIFMLPIAVFCITALVISMDTISTPSVSLEGKSLWIVHSLPIAAAEILSAKVKLHFVLNVIPAVVALIIMCICLKLSVLTSVLIAAAICVYVWFSGIFGLMIGVLNPKLEWTTETTAIKSLSAFVVMLVLWILVAGVGIICWYARNTIAMNLYLVICIAIFALLSVIIYHWLRTKGAEKFANL